VTKAGGQRESLCDASRDACEHPHQGEVCETSAVADRRCPGKQADRLAGAGGQYPAQAPVRHPPRARARASVCPAPITRPVASPPISAARGLSTRPTIARPARPPNGNARKLAVQTNQIRRSRLPTAVAVAGPPSTPTEAIRPDAIPCCVSVFVLSSIGRWPRHSQTASSLLESEGAGITAA
jgi:hypothetical protein